MPALGPAEIAAWTLAIDGCVRTPRAWTHRRAEAGVRDRHRDRRDRMRRQRPRLLPDPAGTVLWRHGAVGCVRWTGVRLGDLLRQCELLPQAVYTGHHSPDVYLDGSGPAISRGLPIAKALAPETLVAFALNGEPLPVAARRPAAAGRAGLSRRVVPEMADAHRGARPRARRRADDATATTGCRARRCATASRSITRSSRSSPTCR